MNHYHTTTRLAAAYLVGRLRGSKVANLGLEFRVFLPGFLEIGP